MARHADGPGDLMRLVLLCLVLCCGAASGAELFQSRPAAILSDNQVRIRNHLASEQGFKSITPIEINKAALNSNIITLTVKGKTYRLEGKLSQGLPFPVTDMSGKVLRIAGQVSWSGRSADSFGAVTYSDLGSLSGQFTLDGQIYKVVSNEGMNGFLVEIEPESAWPDPLFHLPYMPPTLTAEQEKVRDHWAKRPGTISITTVQVDKTALKSNVVTLSIKGKRYRFDGKWTRTELQRIDEGWKLSAWMTFPIIVPSSSMRPGFTSWYGQGSYGSGSFFFQDEGEVSGNFTITRAEGRGHYNLVSAGDIAFLVEHADMAQPRATPEEKPNARDARLEAEARKVTDEKALRSYEGERLFELAEEASLDPQFRYQLEFLPAEKSALGLYPIRVNRLAIDSPVTVFVIDGKEYRFAGKASIAKSPWMAKPVRETAYSGGVTESWDGHTSFGDRAKIIRNMWSMSGDIYVDGRHFAFGTRGEFGMLYDLNPTLLAKRDAMQQRARQEAIREATAKWRPPLVPFVPVETTAIATKPPSPAAGVFSNSEPCAMKTRFLSGLEEAEGFPQPAHFRSDIAELRAIVKKEMVELQC
jgi:hypothetical protein